MNTLWIVGGPEPLADTVRRVATARGVAATVSRSERPTPAAGDAVLDLGSAPSEWAEGEIEAFEAERVRVLAAGMLPGLRVVRTSLLGADRDAASGLQRAHFAAEEAWESAGADLVRLRYGLVLGRFGLQAGWRRLVERFPLVIVPSFDVRFEPILDVDFADYCVLAADPAQPRDPIYDLGCGDMVTNGFFAQSLARELGLSRLVVPIPGFLRGLVARMMSGPDLPPDAAWAWLEAFAGTLLPRRMNAWDAFETRPAALAESLARSLGRTWVEPPRKPQEGFAAWKRTKKKQKPFLR